MTHHASACATIAFVEYNCTMSSPRQTSLIDCVSATNRRASTVADRARHARHAPLPQKSGREGLRHQLTTALRADSSCARHLPPPPPPQVPYRAFRRRLALRRQLLLAHQSCRLHLPRRATAAVLRSSGARAGAAAGAPARRTRGRCSRCCAGPATGRCTSDGTCACGCRAWSWLVCLSVKMWSAD